MVVFGEAARANPHQEIMNYWNNIYSIYYKAPVSVFASSADKVFSVAFVLLLSQLIQRVL